MKKQQHSNKQKEVTKQITTSNKYKNSIKYLWSYIRIYKWRFIFVIVSSILLAGFNSGIIIGEYFFMDYIADIIDTNNKTPHSDNVVLIYLCILFAAVLTTAILFIVQMVTMTKIAQYSGKQIRKDLYFKILELKLQYFDSNPSGDIMSRLTNDVNNITNALSQNITQLFVNSSQILIMIVTLYIFSPILALVALATTPLQLFVIIAIFKKAQPMFIKKQVALGDINAFIEETISGQKVINNFNKQALAVKLFNKKNDVIKNVDYSTQTLSNLPNPWNSFVGSFVICIMFIIASVCAINNINFGGIISTKENGKTNPIAVASLLPTVLMFTKNYTNPIYQIFQMLSLLQGAMAGTERVSVITKQPIEVLPKQETIDVSNLKGDIEFKNLSFSYDGKKDVLKNINLKVKAGQVVGIVGPTGSGKTTIINLLTKFYDVTNPESDILIDGISIKNITKHSLRDEVSIVLQDTFIFGNTIAENLRYANLNATKEDIIKATKEANADHFIESLENGYDTILQNNAEEMSLGEKQLLAISRAFLKKSSILILDEATSSIDTKTEKDIQTGMIKLSKGKTTFMIAHRLSTIKHADIIIVLKDGQILEQGNHHELLKQNGFYASMYNSKLNTPEDI